MKSIYAKIGGVLGALGAGAYALMPTASSAMTVSEKIADVNAQVASSTGVTNLGNGIGSLIFSKLFDITMFGLGFIADNALFFAVLAIVGGIIAYFKFKAR